MTVTQPLRDEHAHLLPHIEALGTTADAVGTAPLDELRRLVDEAHHFLVEHLIPHAVAEDEVLYPVVAAAMGAPEATATMRRDHVEVGALTDELGRLRDRLETVDAVDATLARELRRVLYGLHAVVRLHFAKEEEVYVPILDASLTPEQAEVLFDEMHHPSAHVHHEHPGA